MVVPVISDLPPAPTRNDGAADFTPKADAMIGALQPMVVQVNIALQWMNGRLTDTQAAQAAAAASAEAAAQSVIAATHQVELATAQVGLAAEQVGLANAARQGAEAALGSSQVVAAAVQTSAGLPSLLGNAGKVLAVNSSATGVGWIAIPPVVTPSNLMPVAGTTEVFVTNFTGSSFYSLYGKPQASRQVRASLSPDFAAVLWDSGEVIGTGTTVSGPSLSGLAPVNSLVYWQIRYRDEDGAWSEWSAATSFRTPAQYAPTVPGTAFQGGFYAGRVRGDGVLYALIAAPKASGESVLSVKTSDSSTVGVVSSWDGATNTAAAVAASAAAHPAASFCKNLTIGGYADWALPANYQLELLYRNLKPGTAANDTTSGANSFSDLLGVNYTASAPAQASAAAFKVGGAEAFDIGTYASSTQASDGSVAWARVFSTGLLTTTSKTASSRVRAVRMIRI